MCTDKQDLLSVKFHLSEFSQIYVADSLGLHCCSHCMVALLTVVLGRNVRVLLCVIHSFSILSDAWSKASSKMMPPHSAI